MIVYSSTKYLGGHGTSIGGLLVDSGTFPWEEHKGRQPALNTPDPSYHGAIWTEAVKPLGPIAYIIKARVTLLRDIGSCMSPFNAFLTLQGIETLPLRMERHCPNTAAVAAWLAKRPEVTKVIHPSQQLGEARRRAEKYLRGGQGGLVGFEIKGGKDAGRKFIDALEAPLSRRQHRRRALARHPPGDDDPLAIVVRRAVRHRRYGRLRAPVDRHRAHRRYPGRHRSGAEGGDLSRPTRRLQGAG